MSEKEQNNVAPPNASELISAKAAVAAPADNAASEKNPALAAPPCKTKGEKLYDGLVYWGLNYFANLALSVVIADFFLSGKGHGFFTKTKGYINDGLGRVMSADTAKKWSDIAVKTACLPIGGHFIMAPVKYAEDHKKRFTYWLNRKFFPEEYHGQIELKPLSQMKDSDLPDVVEAPPKVGWGKTAIRRFVYVWPAIIATNSILERGVHVDGKGFNTWIEGKASELSKLEKGTRAERYLKLTVTDSYLTMVSAILTRLTNGTFNIFGGKKDKAKTEQVQPPASEPQPVITSPVMVADEQTPATENTPVIAPVQRSAIHAASARRERNPERFASHVQKLAAEADRQLQPNV